MKWVTIHTTALPHDAQMIKSLLESYDIDVFLKDELTIQTDNFLSSALGGVKIQVQLEQAPQAIGILKEHDYVHPPEEESDFVRKMRKALAPIPVLNKIHPVALVIILITIAAAVFAVMTVE